MKKKIIGFGIVLLLFLAGVITPINIVETGSSKKIVSNKEIDREITEIKKNVDSTINLEDEGPGLLTAELKIRKEDGRWNKNSLSAKVGTILEFKLEVKPFLADEFKDVYIIYATDYFLDPDDQSSLEAFDYIEESSSHSDKIVESDDFYIVWFFPSVKEPLSITFKSKVVQKGTFVPFLITLPREAKTMLDVAIDFDRITATKSKTKNVFNNSPLLAKLNTLFSKLNKYRISNTANFFKKNVYSKNFDYISNKVASSENIDTKTFTDQEFINKNFKNNVETDRKINSQNKQNSMDLNSNYFITAIDHPDNLDNSTIDNIAILKLAGEKEINLSDIKIFMSSDREKWIEVGFSNKGTWNINESILIYELNKRDIKNKYYEVRIMTIEDNIPIAARFVNIDDSQMSASDLIEDKSTYCSSEISLLSDFPDKTSSATWSESCISLALKYYGRKWEEHVADGCWEYQFRLDGIYNGCHEERLFDLELFEDKSGLISVTHPEIGAWNLDENGPSKFAKVAEAVCDQAIGAIPLAGFTYSFGKDLAEALAVAPDIKWTRDIWPPEDASGFAYCFIYVKPNTNWNIKFNLQADPYNFPPFNLNPYWGEGEIIYGEKSPQQGYIDDIQILNPLFEGGTFVINFDKTEVLVKSQGADHIEISGSDLAGRVIDKTVDNSASDDSYYECILTDDLWLFGKFSASSYDKNDKHLDSRSYGKWIINI